MNVGVIVEGGTEKIIVESQAFIDYLNSFGINLCGPVIDANGNGNLLPRHLEKFINHLNSIHANLDHIIIVTDLESEPAIQDVINRISHAKIHDSLVFVSVAAIESWFLADQEAFNKSIKSKEIFTVLDPEDRSILPWERIKKISSEMNARGPGPSKPTFAKRMINNGFDVRKCLKHPNIRSIHYLNNEISSIKRLNKIL
jgi:hypothetical protein